jgi:hypothetical protein
MVTRLTEIWSDVVNRSWFALFIGGVIAPFLPSLLGQDFPLLATTRAFMRDGSENFA